MAQHTLFGTFDNESEDDLIQNSLSFGEAVIWGADWTTETITTQLLKGNIDLKPKFQRRDAWTSQTKSKFIESLILGLPIPQIILAERKDQKGKYIVIDGKQRLLTIRRFFAKGPNDEFESFKLSGLSILTTLNGKKCSELLDEPQYSEIVNQLQNQTIRTTVIKNWPDESFLFTVFLRLNTGSIKLSPQELRQALHPGSFIDFADSFSLNSAAIKKMLRLSSPDFRMRDVEMVIRFFNFKLFLSQYDGNLKSAFDNTVKTLNSNWNDRESEIKSAVEQLEEAINFTLGIFGEQDAFSKYVGQSYQRKFNRAIYDIMVFYFSDSNIREASQNCAEQIRTGFKELSSTNKEFLNSIEQTTKSLNNTETRFKLWGEKLAEIINIKVQLPKLENNRLSLVESTNG